ncbi:MAG: hypothetical protein JWM10_4919 [Myxococcaceae bacterium]|nr:hypothetical protein [Myxococcaceae bacterium]
MTRATETQHHGDEFVERNAWLHLLLGFASWARAFDALLDAHAPAREAASEPADDPADAQLIDFVLGLASMRATLRRHLVAAAEGGRPAPTGRAVGTAGLGAEWLR